MQFVHMKPPWLQMLNLRKLWSLEVCGLQHHNQREIKIILSKKKKKSCVKKVNFCCMLYRSVIQFHYLDLCARGVSTPGSIPLQWERKRVWFPSLPWVLYVSLLCWKKFFVTILYMVMYSVSRPYVILCGA